MDPAEEPQQDILNEALQITGGSRHEAYGSPELNHGCTAELFTSYLRRKYGAEVCLDARDVCMFNVLQKVSRDAHWAQRDNLVDIAGYAANAQEC